MPQLTPLKPKGKPIIVPKNSPTSLDDDFQTPTSFSLRRSPRSKAGVNMQRQSKLAKTSKREASLKKPIIKHKGTDAHKSLGDGDVHVPPGAGMAKSPSKGILKPATGVHKSPIVGTAKAVEAAKATIKLGSSSSFTEEDSDNDLVGSQDIIGSLPVAIKRTNSGKLRLPPKKRIRPSGRLDGASDSEYEDDELKTSTNKMFPGSSFYKFQGVLASIHGDKIYHPARVMNYYHGKNRYDLLLCNGMKLRKSREQFLAQEDKDFLTCEISPTVHEIISKESQELDPLLLEQLNTILPRVKEALFTTPPSANSRLAIFRSGKRDVLIRNVIPSPSDCLLSARLSQDLHSHLCQYDEKTKNEFLALVVVPEALLAMKEAFGEDAKAFEKGIVEWTREILALRDTVRLGNNINTN
ncbi:hypothetical protein BC829DRAFT_489045 [Chytridium lagenaria]|nr:hypothetical protein BC829DRAFT_489045 [Chytridium lagenaria]